MSVLLVFSTGGAATGTPSVTVSPASQSLTGATATRAFAAEVVTVTNGTPTAYNWNFLETDLGNWSITSGQGTASAVFSVSGAVVAEPVSATGACTVTINGAAYTTPPIPLTYTRV